MGCKKLVLSQNKKPYKPETFTCNHKKFVTQSETSLLINCGKVFSSSPESGSGIFATSKWA